MRAYLSLFLLAVALMAIEAKMQQVIVRGVTICNKKRLANVKVELYDRDTLDPNDLLATVNTNSEGEFEITGGEDEVGKIEPFIKITHHCNTKPGCNRVGEYEVPQSHIDAAPYDMTYVNLDIFVKGEKEKC